MSTDSHFTIYLSKVQAKPMRAVTGRIYKCVGQNRSPSMADMLSAIKFCNAMATIDPGAKGLELESIRLQLETILPTAVRLFEIEQERRAQFFGRGTT